MFKRVFVSRASLGGGIVLMISGININNISMTIIGIILFAIGVETCLYQLEDKIKEWVKKELQSKNSDNTSDEEVRGFID